MTFPAPCAPYIIHNDFQFPNSLGLRYLAENLASRPIRHLLLFLAEALMEKPYTDIDYNSFPAADLPVPGPDAIN